MKINHLTNIVYFCDMGPAQENVRRRAKSLFKKVLDYRFNGKKRMIDGNVNAECEKV